MIVIFEWLDPIQRPETRIEQEDSGGAIKIERITPMDAPLSMSPACQFFAAFSVVTGLEAMSSFPMPSVAARDQVMREIAPHYEEVKAVYYDGVLRSVNVRVLKRSSRVWLEQWLAAGRNPVVSDLYRTIHTNYANSPRELDFHRVRSDAFEPILSEETAEMAAFLRLTFFADEGAVLLTPLGWVLDETLRRSVALRALVGMAEELILVVDQREQSVVGIDMRG